MESFEDYIEDVEKTIHFLCLKYNVFYLKDDFLGESFICFAYCKDRFKGRKEEFYFYFKKSLKRHLTKKIFEELKMRNSSLEIEEEVFNNLELKTSNKDIEEIMEEAGFSEIEKKICLLREEGKSFLSISKEIGLSYYKVLSFRDSMKSKLSKVGIYNCKFETRYGVWKKWYNDNKEEYMEYQKSYRERNRERITTY